MHVEISKFLRPSATWRGSPELLWPSAAQGAYRSTFLAPVAARALLRGGLCCALAVVGGSA
eukprot:3165313-Prymnesium_polylepis.1